MEKKAVEKKSRIRIAGIVFIIAVPLVFHFLYSSLGYNPTDDGFILAYGRRLLEGQIPHKDFISIRPSGSAFLHLPEVAFGGDYTFWISRLVFWFQQAIIAICFIKIISILSGITLTM